MVETSGTRRATMQAHIPESTFPVARILFAVLLLGAALLQATFLPALDWIAIVPDFALVFLLIWSATHGPREGLAWAFLLGVWLDYLTLERLGTHGLGLMVVAIIGGATQGRLFRSGMILPLGAVLVATLAFNIMMLVVNTLAGAPTHLIGTLRVALVTAVLNALLVPLAYGVLFVFDRWIPRRVR
jgi:rod shape-determining protein MreD